MQTTTDTDTEEPKTREELAAVAVDLRQTLEAGLRKTRSSPRSPFLVEV